MNAEKLRILKSEIDTAKRALEVCEKKDSEEAIAMKEYISELRKRLHDEWAKEGLI